MSALCLSDVTYSWECAGRGFGDMSSPRLDQCTTQALGRKGLEEEVKEEGQSRILCSSRVKTHQSVGIRVISCSVLLLLQDRINTISKQPPLVY